MFWEFLIPQQDHCLSWQRRHRHGNVVIPESKSFVGLHYGYLTFVIALIKCPTDLCVVLYNHDLTLHVTQPTHKRGHTLELIIKSLNLSKVAVSDVAL